MKPRGPWQGMATIARFNWPFYVAAVVIFLGAVVGFFISERVESKLPCLIAAAGAGYFLAGSLGVSHWIYDRSDLYRWRWIERALRGETGRRVLFCHAGFDEISEALRQKLAPESWQVLDHFDASQMTEASIRRARAWFPPVAGTLAAAFDRWPVATGETDVVFGILAVHELRSEAERAAWFREARRSLRPGGRIVIVEHARDLANFVAFGPGFFHFHSSGSWRRSWEAAGLRARDAFGLTPFVRIWVISADG